MVNEIIEKFKHFCEEREWTHEQIAQKLECSRSYITRIFSEIRTPSAKILDKIEEVMQNDK